MFLINQNYGEKKLKKDPLHSLVALDLIPVLDAHLVVLDGIIAEVLGPPLS